MRLIYYECRKHFFKKAMLFAILIFSVINVCKIYSVYTRDAWMGKPDYADWNAVYWHLYDDYRGNITSDKIDLLLSVYRPLEQKTADRTAKVTMDDPQYYTGSPYGDYYLLRLMYVQPMEYFYVYQNTADRIVAAAKDNMSFYESIGNSYEYRKNEQIAQLFSDRMISNFAYTEMHLHYFQYDFSALLVLLLVLYGLANVFTSEKEADMDVLLLTTALGGARTVAAKIAASMLYVITICFWFWALDYISFSVIFRSIDAVSLPVYALECFQNTPISITLGQFACLGAIVKTIGMLVLSMIFLFISGFFKSALLPFIFNLLLSFGLIYSHEAYAGSSQILFKILNPFALIINRTVYGSTEFLSVLNQPILSYKAALIVAMIVIVSFTFIILMTARKNAMRRKGGALCK